MTGSKEWNVAVANGRRLRSELRGNRLPALPDGIGNLTKLTWLDLDGNQPVEDA